MPTQDTGTSASAPRSGRGRGALPVLLMLLVLLVAGYLRFVGLNWDENTHPHPDERFLTMVETDIRLPSSLGEYFDTETSPLNPHNANKGFFVYGTLPIFIVRFVAEGMQLLGYDQVHLVGRAASATFDLISVFLVYLIASRLYRRRVGVLAAAFAGLSVLLIQHAHYFVVDPFANTFILAGFYMAVRAMDEGGLANYGLFGLALGMAMASKISAAPLAGVIVLAALVRVSRVEPQARRPEIIKALGGVALAAGASILSFRIFQPYAFMGTWFLDLRLNPKWLDNLAELRRLSSGDIGFPPAWQWVNRTPLLFSLGNLVLWGMGLPLGLVAWASWAWAISRMVRGDWRRHALPVVWTGAFFIWQSTSFTKAMRYLLPIYPTLAILAAWGLWQAWELASQAKGRLRPLARAAVGVVGTGTLLATAVWAFAFLSIYTSPESRVAASRWMYSHIPGTLNLVVDTPEGELLEPIAMPMDFSLGAGQPYLAQFTNHLDGVANAILLPKVTNLQPEAETVLQVTLTQTPDSVALASASYSQALLAGAETSLELPLEEPIGVSAGTTYFLKLELLDGGPLAMRGSTIVGETGWDLGLPFRVDGRDGYGGLYTGIDQDLYASDDEDRDQTGLSDKLERLVRTLSEGDYLVISSNRQYASITRAQRMFPLTMGYYRALFGCPEPEPVWRCGAEAEVGQLQGELGYELIAVFESNPQLGPLEISDQGAEEAFTVYDHAKVMIFAKADDFSAQRVQEVLAQVDLSGLVVTSPKEVGSPPRDLLLPHEQWEKQQASGTWSNLYDLQSTLNRSPLLAVVAWWGLIALIGWLAFPLVRMAFPGLQDGGYSLARIVGLLLVGWGSWILSSFGIPFSPTTIVLVMLVLAIASAFVAWRDREALVSFFRQRWKLIVWIEILALAFFAVDLLIRLGNPDLWHPFKGGEKPMDFSYLNAVLKSVSFPPYDPWFAGGYINYYYFGFVLVSVPVKLLGIVPAIAYNLILPSLFAMLALGAYSVGSNLVDRFVRTKRSTWRRWSCLAGMAAALALVVFGNLGTGAMIYGGLKELGAPAGEEPATFVKGAFQATAGTFRYLGSDTTLPYAMDQWYWNPSRSIPAEFGEAGPITEFPFFTFLYADLHAHMISMPLSVAGIAWAVSWLLAAEKQKRRRRIDIIVGLFMGGLILGSLRATNTWEMPLYLGVGVLAVAAAAWVRARRKLGVELAILILALLIGLRQTANPWATPMYLVLGALGAALLTWLLDQGPRLKILFRSALYSLILVIAAVVLFQPYIRWYGQGYSAVDLWQGSHTSLGAYLTVHGLFLFVLLTWMAWETRQWMAATPLSDLNRLRPYLSILLLAAAVVVIATIVLLAREVAIAPLVILASSWAGLLLLRRDMPLEKRIVLLLTACGLVLTLAVEVIVLRGDIGRMNTVFKFYLQVWTLFSLSAAAAFVWLLPEVPSWRPFWRVAWSVITGLLVFAAALYPLTATPAKIMDRMAPESPHTLDGMAFIPYASYYDLGQVYSLDEDYRAIRWMQENIQGSPVIVEANVPEYRWGSRFTIYTGLPGVLGWNWHQRQQRVATGTDVVTDRAIDIATFYTTPSLQEAWGFLQEYGVRYVVVGKLERIYYESVQPCWPMGEGVTCDMAGRPMGMFPPEVSPAACEALDPSAEDSPLVCPTYGIAKFERMQAQGMLRIIYQDGETMIYEVVR
ncbi:MAG: DUF2298 domain-containing protein [Anaerolineales bacterium]